MRFRNIVSVASVVLVSLGLVCCAAKSPQVASESSTLKCSSASCLLTKKRIPPMVEGKTWTEKVKPIWNVSQDPNVDKKDRTLKVELSMESDKFEDGTYASVAIMTTPWSGTDEEFAMGAAKEFVTLDGLIVVQALTGLVDDHPATIVVSMLSDGSGVLVQLATSAGQVGHVVRCAGPTLHTSEVMDMCGDIVGGFSLKPVVDERPKGVMTI